ncbi:MAG: hypothetical protein II123_03675 [Lachnospiraceae bacterium]|nr:hypothetical protein [Lachnospiraceae bacterium]
MAGFIFTILSSFGFYIFRDHPALDFTYSEIIQPWILHIQRSSSLGFYVFRDHPALDFTYPNAAWHVPAFLESPGRTIPVILKYHQPVIFIDDGLDA